MNFAMMMKSKISILDWHKFHNWYIIRIGGNGKITFKMEKSMYEISGENIIQILNSENKEFIITASYTEL